MPVRLFSARVAGRARFIAAIAIWAIGASLPTTHAASADVALPSIFGDHMVLQRDIDVPIWGTGKPGEEVTVTAGSDTATATADADGKWMVRLTKLKASAIPIDVTVAGNNTITFKDVLVGDVWLCSGQSNMEFGIGNDGDAKFTIAAANEPAIRIFTVPLVTARTPQADFGKAPADLPLLGSWQVCTPDTLAKDGEWKGFSATAYYFGRNIQQFTNEPVGLISCSWGGTFAQAWTSFEALSSTPQLIRFARGAVAYARAFDRDVRNYETVRLPAWQAAYDKWKTDVDTPYQASVKQLLNHAKPGKPTTVPAEPPAPPRPQDPNTDPNVPSAVYNGMIAPLVPFGIKGVVWSQGESNTDQPVLYSTLFPALISDWRKHWGEGDFPFLYVQLANYKMRSAVPTESDWAALREAQLKTLSVPNTGMAVTIDIGNGMDIHPSDKWDVGDRLALAARYTAYHDFVVYSGPTYRSMTIEGAKVRVMFNNLGSGLAIGRQPPHFKASVDAPFSKTKLEGFEVAGADNKFYRADAAIDGSSVIVSSPNVPSPVSVRYAWADNPAANLYNANGLPASPFRTDTLPVGEQANPTRRSMPALGPTPALR